MLGHSLYVIAEHLINAIYMASVSFFCKSLSLIKLLNINSIKRPNKFKATACLVWNRNSNKPILCKQRKISKYFFSLQTFKQHLTFDAHAHYLVIYRNLFSRYKNSIDFATKSKSIVLFEKKNSQFKAKWLHRIYLEENCLSLFDDYAWRW